MRAQGEAPLTSVLLGQGNTYLSSVWGKQRLGEVRPEISECHSAAWALPTTTK